MHNIAAAEGNLPTLHSRPRPRWRPRLICNIIVCCSRVLLCYFTTDPQSIFQDRSCSGRANWILDRSQYTYYYYYIPGLPAIRRHYNIMYYIRYIYYILCRLPAIYNLHRLSVSAVFVTCARVQYNILMISYRYIIL